MCDYRPRLTFDITEEQRRKIQKYFPHGSIKLVFQLIVSDFLEMIERHGAGVILGTFVDRSITLEEILCGNDPELKRVCYGNGVSGRSRNSSPSEKPSSDRQLRDEEEKGSRG